MSEGHPAAAALSPADAQRAQELAKQIDLADPQAAAQFGSGVQRRLGDASGMLLRRITEDAPAGDDLLQQVLALADSLDLSPLSKQPGPLARLLGTRRRELGHLSRRWDEAAQQMDSLAGQLDDLRMDLLKDVGIYEQLHERNDQYLQDLDVALVAGEQALLSWRSSAPDTPDARAQAERFERRLHDLKLSRMLALQMGPQIRLMQQNNEALADRMQQTVTQVIPLWRNQMTLAVGLARQQGALKAQRAVSEAAERSIRGNADALQQTTKDIARESQQGLRSLDSLQAAQRSLHQAVQDALSQQQQARQQRAKAEEELLQIEAGLKQAQR